MRCHASWNNSCKEDNCEQIWFEIQVDVMIQLCFYKDENKSEFIGPFSALSPLSSPSTDWPPCSFRDKSVWTHKGIKGFQKDSERLWRVLKEVLTL